jgi:hypothetical protein
MIDLPPDIILYINSVFYCTCLAFSSSRLEPAIVLKWVDVLIARDDVFGFCKSKPPDSAILKDWFIYAEGPFGF